MTYVDQCYTQSKGCNDSKQDILFGFIFETSALAGV